MDLRPALTFLLWLLPAACSHAYQPLTPKRPTECGRAGDALGKNRRSPLKFSAANVLDRLDRVGTLDVVFPPPDDPTSPDLTAVSRLAIDAELLGARNLPPATYVDNTAADRDECPPFERYLRVPMRVVLSDPEGGLALESWSDIVADSLSPSTWLLGGHAHARGTLSDAENARLAAALEAANPARGPLGACEARGAWFGLGTPTLALQPLCHTASGGEVQGSLVRARVEWPAPEDEPE